jgi:hypothetical protein
MPGISEIFDKIGASLGMKPKAKAGVTSAKPAAQSASGGKKPFDINLYFKAVGMFFSDFFGKKVPYFFQNMGPVFKEAPAWWTGLPQDEQISYVLVVFGNMAFIAGIVLFFVL